MKIKVSGLDEFLIEKFITFCCDPLGIYPELIRIETYDSALKNNSSGLCYQINLKEEYLIMVPTRDHGMTEIYDIIATELNNVKKIMSDSNSNNMTNEHIPAYVERWWENKNMNLVKKYVDILQSMV